ncbi:alanine racemase [Oribacterium sp. KHPX15]|uniref:alanine racemase n=1 Tax=unclassified Oribacterium TaxID=2629782 RepID=UPI0004E25255|nr:MULTISPECIES: alanine racemase [unclassified Oribacterium]SEA90335.1 alanine racemase [Oribacterium sp. KHPX15]
MTSTLKRTWAEINLDNLAYNYKKIREYIGENVKFLGVVKADAYGHGSVQVASKLQSLGADYLAVSSIDEAMELRVNDVTMPILILGHTPKEQVDRLISYNITQAVTCEAKAIEYNEEALRLGKTLKIHIKVDTGMSRLGYICEGDYFQHGVDGIVDACELPGLEPEGIFTHFAVSDEAGEEYVEYTKHQFKLFTDIIDAVEKKTGMKFKIRHCANTGATVDYPETYLDMVRPGLLLYGYGDYAKRLGLKPIMTMKTTVSTIKIYPAGTKISYGGLFTTTKDRTRIGVVPYGYADGFFRSLSNKYSVMTADGPAEVRGRICMDMCMIDLTDKPDVGVGSEIEIFGANNPIEKMAEMAGTIPYEIVCAVSKRVHRVYISDGNVVFRELMLRM